MNVYTRNGDKGRTTLLNGESVAKDDVRINLLGEIDELNSNMGLIKSRFDDKDITLYLENIQKNLMKIMSDIVDEGDKDSIIREQDISDMEKKIDGLQSLYPVQNKFVIPGENEISAFIDIARTVARRAERGIIEVEKLYPMGKTIKQYMNRLSDYLYVLARYNDFITKISHEVKQAIRPQNRIVSPNNNISGLNLETAKLIAESIEKKSKEMGLSAVICIVGFDGNPILIHVMDGSYLASFEAAMSKAYSAVALKMPTEELNKLAQPGEMFFGIESLNKKKIIIIGGGVLLKIDGNIAGGLGVSGGTDKQDILLANYGKEFFESAIQRTRHS